MSDNIYRKDTDTLELFSGRIADAYTKAQTDEKLGQINTKLSENEEWLAHENLFIKSEARIDKMINSDGSIVTDIGTFVTNDIFVKGGNKVYIGKRGTARWGYFDANMQNFVYGNTLDETFTMPYDGYLRLSVVNSVTPMDKYRVELGGLSKSNVEITQDIADLEKLNPADCYVIPNASAGQLNDLDIVLNHPYIMVGYYVMPNNVAVSGYVKTFGNKTYPNLVNQEFHIGRTIYTREYNGTTWNSWQMKANVFQDSVTNLNDLVDKGLWVNEYAGAGAPDASSVWLVFSFSANNHAIQIAQAYYGYGSYATYIRQYLNQWGAWTPVKS